MLFLSCKFVYIITLAFAYGYALHAGLSRRAGGMFPFPLAALAGLMGISVIAACLSLFLPLGIYVQALLFMGGVVCLFIYRPPLRRYLAQVKQCSLPSLLFFSAAAVYVLYLSSQPSITYDEGLYYLPFIKWMQRYPVVPGLANLHERFGFNSHWHVLAAVFDLRLNGVLYLLVMMYLLPGGRDTRFVRVLKAGFLVLMNMPQVCVYNIIAPAPDLVVFYCCCLLAVLWLEHKGAVLLLIAPACLVTFKASALPLLLIPAYFYWQAACAGQYRRIVTLTVILFVALAPWVARNVVLTGYPVFPAVLPDIFHADWKVPLSVVQATKMDITAFAWYRVADIAAFKTDPLLHRIQVWFMDSLRWYDKVLVIMALLSPVVALLRRRYLPARALPLYIFLLLGCLFWFTQAPDPRFGYGYLISLFVISVTLVVIRIRRVHFMAMAAALLLQAGTVGLHQRLLQRFVSTGVVVGAPHYAWWLEPAGYGVPALVRHERPFIYYTPERLDQCWDAPLPCADRKVEGVVMRGKELGRGFRRE